MMSWRVVVVLIGIGLGAVWSSHPESPRIRESADRPVAIATLSCETNLQATSSGFVLDDELVVTTAHAIFESRDFAVRDATGRWHNAFVRHMDLERDLAIVQVEGLRAVPIQIAEAADGDFVQMIDGAASGTASGRIVRRVRIKTQVIGDRSRENSRRGYELLLDIAAGDSGAGIVDSDDNLVAVVFARSTSRAAVTWVTSVSEVAAIRDLESVPEWDCGPPLRGDLVLRPAEPAELAEPVEVAEP